LRQHELDLAREVVEPEHKAELTLAASVADLLHDRAKSARIIEVDLHAGVARLGRLLERDETLHAYFYRLAVRFGLDVEQDRRPGLEQWARGGKQFASNWPVASEKATKA